MSFISKLTVATAAAAIATAAVPATAAEYLLVYTPTGASDYGTTTPTPARIRITTANTLNSAGGYDVLSIFGTFGSMPISAIVTNPNQPAFATSPSGLFYYDNVFYPGTAPDTGLAGVDNNGLLFTVGGTEYNLFSNSGHYDLLAGVPGYDGSTGTLAISAVPESAAWAMMLLGFGVIGFGMRRRQQPAVRVTYA